MKQVRRSRSKLFNKLNDGGKFLPSSQGHDSDVQARQQQLDFLETMKVFEEVYEDELPAGTHVMSGRWVDAMKKLPKMSRSKYTARGYEEPHSDEGCFAATATTQGIGVLMARCLDKRDQGYEAFVPDCTQAFLNAEVREGEQLYAQPPEGWNPKILTDGRPVVCKVCKAMLGLRTSPRRWQELVEQVERTRFRSR